MKVLPHRRLVERIVLVVLGLTIIGIAGIAQTSSRFTPVLADYPILLFLSGSAGVNLMLLTAIAFGCLAILHRQRSLYFVMVFCAALAGLMEINIWLRVFQISVAGLTLGGSLVLLGCSSFSLPTNMSRRS